MFLLASFSSKIPLFLYVLLHFDSFYHLNLLDILTTSDNIENNKALERRRLAVMNHETQVGLDFINVEDARILHDNQEKLYLYFIPSGYEGKNAVPDITAKNIIISE